MTNELKLHQARRAARIIKKIIGVECINTSYYAWEYPMRNNSYLEILYINSSKEKSYKVYTHTPIFKIILETNSIKELVTHLRK